MSSHTRQLLFCIVVFIAVSVLFNFAIFRDLFSGHIIISDNIVTELGVESSYQNILHFKNPFILETVAYPFRINISLNDPSTTYVIPFLLLRIVWNPHQSIAIILLINFFLNNLVMYMLLKKMKFSYGIALITSLVFGFTPFLSHRIVGHYTYIPIYFLPLVFYVFQHLVEVHERSKKIFLSIFLGLIFALVLLSNFYYFFLIILGIFLSSLYWFIRKKQVLFSFALSYIRYIIVSIIALVVFLLPWFISVYNLIHTEGISKTEGFGGAFELSADIANFIIPSEFNPLYKILFAQLGNLSPLLQKYNHLYLNNWEKFVYPGALILIVYGAIVVLKLTKKFPKNLWNKISFYFGMSIMSAVFVLGPILKVFHRWSINLDGILVEIPLPFYLLHFIPGLSTLRAPSRLTPLFVFFACIVFAYCLEHFMKRVHDKKKILLYIIIFCIFVTDQFYINPIKPSEDIPLHIYSYLKNTNNQDTVLEIPFTVRDGFRYLGFIHALQPIYGKTIDDKPTMGAYIARLPAKVFDYYENLPFIGYVLKTIDKGNYNPLSEKPKEIIVTPYPYSIHTIQDELSSLNISYVILKTDEVYSAYFSDIFSQVGFIPAQSDGNYILLERNK